MEINIFTFRCHKAKWLYFSAQNSITNTDKLFPFKINTVPNLQYSTLVLRLKLIKVIL